MLSSPISPSAFGDATKPESVNEWLTITGENAVLCISVKSRDRAGCLTLAKLVCFRIFFLLSAEIKKAHELD